MTLFFSVRKQLYAGQTPHWHVCVTLEGLHSCLFNVPLSQESAISPGKKIVDVKGIKGPARAKIIKAIDDMLKRPWPLCEMISV
jgi:hypothetical protein